MGQIRFSDEHTKEVRLRFCTFMFNLRSAPSYTGLGEALKLIPDGMACLDLQVSRDTNDPGGPLICQLQARVELEPIVDCEADLAPDDRLQHTVSLLLR